MEICRFAQRVGHDATEVRSGISCERCLRSCRELYVNLNGVAHATARNIAEVNLGEKVALKV